MRGGNIRVVVVVVEGVVVVKEEVDEVEEEDAEEVEEDAVVDAATSAWITVLTMVPSSN